MFLRVNFADQLEVPDPELRIRYYHHDHLSSSTVISDAAGKLIEQSNYYPFGSLRNDSQAGVIKEDYQFTQKEQDKETGLHYFEARFAASILGRFLIADRLFSDVADLNTNQYNNFLENPQKSHLYALADNNPIRYVDRSGNDTVQVNLGANGRVGPIQGNASLSLACDDQGECAILFNYAGGAAGGTDVKKPNIRDNLKAGGGMSSGIDYSNAKTVRDLAGPFKVGTVSAGPVTAQGFTGKGSHGQQVTGGGLAVGPSWPRTPNSNLSGGGGVSKTHVLATFLNPVYEAFEYYSPSNPALDAAWHNTPDKK